ncbi:hypothetical protein DRO54_09825 [Candidatus Bathyarchaeota archaeon]|nr:MAG: hypothetical protein DRO54_09825 [Candidatus Bathyarchaeota archaeon]
MLDLYIASKAGFTGERIIYDGPFKPVEALREALEKEVLLINCESFTELERLNNIAKKAGIKQPIGLRVNPYTRPSFLRSLHPKTLLEEAAFCFPKCRFGFSIEETRMAFNYLKKMKNLSLECLMMHPYHRAISVLMPLFREAYEKFEFEMKYLNIGGGFDPGTTSSTGDLLLALDYIKARLGIKSSKNKEKRAQKIEDVAKTIIEELKRSLGDLPEPTLITEPGRFIAGPAGLLLLRVDHVKVAGGYKWVVVDGGTNIVPIFYERRRLLVANNGSALNTELVNVVGPLLYPKDFVAIKTTLPDVKEGDIIAVLDCGAYSLSSSTQFLYPRPPAVLVNTEGYVKTIREKETFDDVICKDRF